MRSMRSRRDKRAAWSTVKGVLALARAIERGGDRLDHGGQLARCERDEGHAGAIGVARATRTVSITVEGRSVGALEAVVLADDPFLHGAMSSLGRAGYGTSQKTRHALPTAIVSVFVRILSARVGLEKRAKREIRGRKSVLFQVPRRRRR